MELVLASASPRRHDLLKSMGVCFQVHSTDIDETRREGEAAEDFVTRLARDKAHAAQTALANAKLSTSELSTSKLSTSELAILAADTIVVQDQSVFGKPVDLKHAQQIWQSLSGAKHQVMTAVALLVHDKLSVKLGVTEVEFGRISAEQMRAYWESGEPQDKAGGYAIQGLASAWVKLLHGSYSNVVGLPLREVNELLSTIDKNWL